MVCLCVKITTVVSEIHWPAHLAPTNTEYSVSFKSVHVNMFQMCLLIPVSLLVNGNWGPWSPYTPCPVTCGVGLQVSVRRCDNPSPKHGGQPCPGEERQTTICSTNVHCPGTLSVKAKISIIFISY